MDFGDRITDKNVKFQKVTICPHSNIINSIDLYKTLLLSAGEDDKIVLINLRDFSMVNSFYDCLNGVNFAKILNEDLLLYYGHKTNKLILSKHDGSLLYMFEIVYENIQALEVNLNVFKFFTVQKEKIYLFNVDPGNKSINFEYVLSNDSYLAKFNSTGDKMITASCSQLTKRYEISLYVRRANQFKLLRKLDKTSKSKITKVSFSSSDTKLIVMTQKTNGEKTSVVFIISLIDDELIYKICKAIDDLYLDFTVKNNSRLFVLTTHGNIFYYNIYSEDIYKRYVINKSNNSLISNGSIVCSDNNNLLVSNKSNFLIIYSLEDLTGRNV